MLTKKAPTQKEETGNTNSRPTKRPQAPTFEEIPLKKAETPANATQNKAAPRSKILIKYNVGFFNHLTIRGEGADLSWHKGQPLKNIGTDEWVWETDVPFAQLEFKVLINDHHYELGNNHKLKKGECLSYTPLF